MPRQRRTDGLLVAPSRKLLDVDPLMQRWCALLEAEVSSWPDVTCRPMFGLGAYYRRQRIFAAIPNTRAMGTPFSLLIKQPGRRGARLSTGRGPGAGWTTFELESETGIADALGELGRAYERAGAKKAAPGRQVRR